MTPTITADQRAAQPSAAAMTLNRMAQASTRQEDWSGGMYRGRRAPANAAYDLVNFLIDDEGRPFRRGGSAYKSNADATDALVGLFDGYLAAGLRTLAWAANGGTHFYYRLGSDDATIGAFASVGDDVSIDPWARGAIVNGVLALPCAKNNGYLFRWAGARGSVNTTNPTISVTSGSPTVTASGTSWLSKYEPGTIILGSPGIAGDSILVVKSVDSDTQMTLTAPFPGDTASGPVDSIKNFLESVTASSTFPAVRLVAATGTPARLWAIVGGNRAYYSDRGNPWFDAFDTATNYIELPTSSYIVGADSFRDTLVLFSTEGIWTVSNTDLDPVDDGGNIQWQQAQVTRELVLWGDPGVASFSGALLVPGVDDVYLFTPDGTPTPITGGRFKYDGGIRGLYRSYVSAGYQPGTAATYRGHYVLPIVNGTTVVDVLVCRLDHGFAWSRWSAGASGGAYQRRSGSDTRSPKLLALNAKRITDLTGVFDPSTSNASDADGTAHQAQLVTNDFPLGSQPGFADRTRLTYELTSNGSGSTPTVAVEFSSDQDAGSFTTLTDKGLQGGGTGGATQDGSKFSWWSVKKRRQKIRFRVTQSGAAGSFVVRALDLFSRPQGRQ